LIQNSLTSGDNAKLQKQANKTVS